MNTVILTALISTSVLFGGSMMLNNNDCNEKMENYYQDDASFGESQNHMNDSKYKGMMGDDNNYSKMHMSTNDYQEMMGDYDNNESSMHMNNESNLKRNSHMSDGSRMHNDNGHGMRN